MLLKRNKNKKNFFNFYLFVEISVFKTEKIYLQNLYFDLLLCNYKGKKMKKLVTFRINEDVLVLIESLAKEYETSKVHIVENAIKTYANLKKFKNKDLLKFLGKIDEKDIKKMRSLL